MAKRPSRKTKAGRGDKTPKAEVERRVDQAESLLLQGLSDRQVQKLLVSAHDVHPRTASRYVSGAYERWRDAAREEDGRTVEERRKEHEGMIRHILATAGKEGRIDLQLRGVEMLVRLYGTAASSRVELTGKDGGPLAYQNLSRDELASLVADAKLEPLVIH